MDSIVLTDSKQITISKSCSIILNTSQADLFYDLKDGEYAIMIFNDHKGPVNLYDHGCIQNAFVRINYLQLEAYDLVQKSEIYVEKNSTLNISSTYLGIQKKEVVFDLYNNGTDSSVDIYNNIVCMHESDFSMDVIGSINKGAKRSKCHQSTHCLTIDLPKKARVLPILNIDENDVEASHSLASGTIDEEVLFYMNSRGLNKKEALNLILRSYLMPNDRFYEGFVDAKMIQERAVAKVDEICSM